MHKPSVAGRLFTHCQQCVSHPLFADHRATVALRLAPVNPRVVVAGAKMQRVKSRDSRLVLEHGKLQITIERNVLSVYQQRITKTQAHRMFFVFHSATGATLHPSASVDLKTGRSVGEDQFG